MMTAAGLLVIIVDDGGLVQACVLEARVDAETRAEPAAAMKQAAQAVREQHAAGDAGRRSERAFQEAASRRRSAAEAALGRNPPGPGPGP